LENEGVHIDSSEEIPKQFFFLKLVAVTGDDLLFGFFENFPAILFDLQDFNYSNWTKEDCELRDLLINYETDPSTES